jgi:hypothetical protein
VSFVLTIVTLNAVDTLVFNLEQIVHFQTIDLHTTFYEAWTSVAELFEDFIILVNGVGFLFICLRVYQSRH